VNLFRGRLVGLGVALAARTGFTSLTVTGRAETGAPAGSCPAPAGPGGPAEDTVAGAMSALFVRHFAGDFVAVEMLLRKGRFTRDQLVAVLRERDPGYDPYHFVRALAELPKIPDEQLRPYGLDDDEIAVVRARFADWFHALIGDAIA
jgi:hypothetical protein